MISNTRKCKCAKCRIDLLPGAGIGWYAGDRMTADTRKIGEFTVKVRADCYYCQACDQEKIEYIEKLQRIDEAINRCLSKLNTYFLDLKIKSDGYTFDQAAFTLKNQIRWMIELVPMNGQIEAAEKALNIVRDYLKSKPFGTVIEYDDFYSVIDAELSQIKKAHTKERVTLCESYVYHPHSRY